MDGARAAGSETVRTCTEEALRLLPQRVEDHRPGLLADRAIFGVAHHADNLVAAARSLAAIAEAFSDGVFVAKESARESLIDQGH